MIEFKSTLFACWLFSFVKQTIEICHRTLICFLYRSILTKNFLAPVLMWVKAFDILMDRLTVDGADFGQIAAISGSAQVYRQLLVNKQKKNINNFSNTVPCTGKRGRRKHWKNWIPVSFCTNNCLTVFQWLIVRYGWIRAPLNNVEN